MCVLMGRCNGKTVVEGTMVNTRRFAQAIDIMTVIHLISSLDENDDGNLRGLCCI